MNFPSFRKQKVNWEIILFTCNDKDTICDVIGLHSNFLHFINYCNWFKNLSIFTWNFYARLNQTKEFPKDILLNCRYKKIWGYLSPGEKLNSKVKDRDSIVHKEVIKAFIIDTVGIIFLDLISSNSCKALPQSFA